MLKRLRFLVIFIMNFILKSLNNRAFNLRFRSLLLSLNQITIMLLSPIYTSTHNWKLLLTSPI